MVALLIVSLIDIQAQGIDHKKKSRINTKKKVLYSSKRHHQPHTRYEHLPERGAFVKHCPKASEVILIDNIRYCYYDGFYYKPWSGGFVISAAPLNSVVKKLPNDHLLLTVHNQQCYYYYGTFYRYIPKTDNYLVIKPPIGAEVNALPGGYSVKVAQGEVYYILDDTWYQEIKIDDQTSVYRVINPL